MPFWTRTRTSAAPEYLIVGLGNPGKKYETTRHNAGFLCVDLLAQKHGGKLTKLKFHALCGEVRLRGRRCLLLKPQTYMNNSGEAVREAAQFYHIAPEKIIVISDDTALEFGKMRIRRKGSDGGQKGLKSIIQHLGSEQFPRIKIGIGAKPSPQWDLADWVLSRFTEKELKELRSVCDDACDALELLVTGDVEEAMGRYN